MSFLLLVSLVCPISSWRVTALSSDNGRQLACHAKNPALFRPVETTVTMSVYCECLSLFLNWQLTLQLLKKQGKKTPLPTNTQDHTGTKPWGGPRVSGLVHSVCVNSPRRNIQPEGKLTPTWRQHKCDCLQFTSLTLVGWDWYDLRKDAVFLR